MNTYIFTDEEIKAVQKQLPEGAIVRIADELNYTKGYVSQVLNGKKKPNLEIFKKAIEEIENADFIINKVKQLSKKINI